VPFHADWHPKDIDAAPPHPTLNAGHSPLVGVRDKVRLERIGTTGHAILGASSRYRDTKKAAGTVAENANWRLSGLTTAHIADACLLTGSPFVVAPFSMAPLSEGMAAHGPVRPVRHYGSVDVFLEAIDVSSRGEVLVIDNGGRTDEGCIGDLVALEVRAAGLVGIVVWGLHRDTSQLIEVGLPVFSLGATPVGPRRLDRREGEAFSSARIGDSTVCDDHWAIADSDGVIFVNGADLGSLLETAEQIRSVEQRQADGVRQGRTLREQLLFNEYREKASADPEFTLRQHLSEIGGAIET